MAPQCAPSHTCIHWCLHQHKPSLELLLHVSSSSCTSALPPGKDQQNCPLCADPSSPKAAGEWAFLRPLLLSWMWAWPDGFHCCVWGVVKLHAQAHTHSHTEKIWLKIPCKWISTSKGNYYVTGHPQPVLLHLLHPKEELTFYWKTYGQIECNFAVFNKAALLWVPFFFPGSLSQSKQRLIPHWKEAGPSWYFTLMAKKHKAPLICRSFSKMFFSLDFPRHIREVKPGANNPDLYLCGCNTLLAAVDPLHSQAEEGKNGQGYPGGTCLSLPAFAHAKKILLRPLGLLN